MSLAKDPAGTATPPHAPEGGWTKRLLGPLHVTGVFWYKLPLFGVRHVMPSWAYAPFVYVITALFFVFLVKIRKAVTANLEAVLGPAGLLRGWLRAYRTLVAFAWCYGERYERVEYPGRFHVTVETDPTWQEVLDSGLGAVFVTAHVGTWEMASHLVSTSLRRHVHVVRESEISPAAQKFMAELLQKTGDPLHSVHYATDDPRLGMILMEALRNGEMVALQGDRPRANGKFLTATLFGRPMPYPIGPAALARSAGAWIVPTFGFRDARHRYRVVVRRPFKVGASGNRSQAIEEATQRIAREVEWAISQAPHQWFCFRRLWS